MGRYSKLLLCLFFVILWSSGWIGAKFGQEYAGTFTLLTFRYLLVVFVLFIIVCISRAWRSMTPSQFLLHAIIGVLSHAFYLGSANSAIDLGVSAGLVAFITALQPLMTATLSSGISGEHNSYRQWMGLLLGLAAVILVISDKITLGGSLSAYSLPFLAILAISVASLLDRRISLHNSRTRSKNTPLPLVCLIHCTSALLVLTPVAYFREGLQAQWGEELVFSILWLALLVSLGAYGLLFYMLRQMSATRVASLEYLAPPTTMLIAYFAFAEHLTSTDFLGLIIAALAVWIVLSKPGHSPATENKRIRRRRQKTEILTRLSTHRLNYQ